MHIENKIPYQLSTFCVPPMTASYFFCKIRFRYVNAFCTLVLWTVYIYINITLLVFFVIITAVAELSNCCKVREEINLSPKQSKTSMTSKHLWTRIYSDQKNLEPIISTRAYLRSSCSASHLQDLRFGVLFEHTFYVLHGGFYDNQVSRKVYLRNRVKYL